VSTRSVRRRAPFVLVVVVVVVAVALLWWWQRRPGGPEPPGEPRELTLDAPWFALTSSGPQSGMSQVTVTVSPADDLGPRVGFYETETQGAGDTWRAAAWMATVVASLTSGTELGEYVPSFTVDGRIDGPSAGGLLAVAIMAALHGHQLLPDATMTGTVTPDGAVGPVAGVVHKLEAARRAGKRLLVIPRGQREDINQHTGQPIDLLAYGKALGVEVREVDDLAGAYQALTGHPLRVPRKTGREPELSSGVQAALSESTSEWLRVYEAHMRACQRVRNKLAGSVDVDRELAEARATAERAGTLGGSGAAAAAHDHAVTAALQAAVLEEVLGILDRLAAHGTTAIRDRLASVDTADDTRADVLAAIDGLQISTPNALLAAGDAYGIVAEASGLRLAVQQLLDELDEGSEDGAELDSLFKAAVIVALHQNVLRIAKDRLRLAVAAPPAPARREPTRDGLSAWAETLERAAEANLSYFETVCLDESARDQGLHPDVVRDWMACQDLTYLLARSSLAALPSLRDGLGEPERRDAATLGTSIGVYTAASALIAKFYSLRVEMDAQGNTTGVENEAALERMLEFAGREARASIEAARSRRAEPVLPTYYYLVGRTYAQGDTLEELEALQCFWHASLSARIAVLLSAQR
jgi:uncharacterized protein